MWLNLLVMRLLSLSDTLVAILRGQKLHVIFFSLDDFYLAGMAVRCGIECVGLIYTDPNNNDLSLYLHGAVSAGRLASLHLGGMACFKAAIVHFVSTIQTLNSHFQVVWTADGNTWLRVKA